MVTMSTLYSSVEQIRRSWISDRFQKESVWPVWTALRFDRRHKRKEHDDLCSKTVMLAHANQRPEEVKIRQNTQLM